MLDKINKPSNTKGNPNNLIANSISWVMDPGENGDGFDNLQSFGFKEEDIKFLSTRTNCNYDELFDIVLGIMTKYAYYNIWRKEILDISKEINYEKTHIEKYIEIKYDLIQNHGFSSDEFNTLFKYNSEAHMWEKISFLNAILTTLSDKHLDKSDILYGIEKITTYLLDKEIEYNKIESKKMVNWQEAFLNILLIRKSIWEKWLEKGLLDQWLTCADANYRIFYLHTIYLELWTGRREIQDIAGTLDLFTKVIEKHETELKWFMTRLWTSNLNIWIEKLNPSYIFNYIIILKNRDTSYNSIKLFINDERKTVKDTFPDDISFLWKNEEPQMSRALRYLCKIAMNKRWFMNNNDDHTSDLATQRMDVLVTHYRQKQKNKKGSFAEQLAEFLW